MDIPIEWAFGAGDQAVTFVTRVNEAWYLEHYYSYYSALQAMAPTPGQNVLRPKTLPEAMGLLYKTLDPDAGIAGCFECHSTGPVSVGPKNELQPSELGVRCEACHGPGRLHVEAIARGDVALARETIQNPARFSAEELNHFCGLCHRPPASTGVEIDWSYSWNVRHQPVYLSQSRCFTESSGRLKCLTCHGPHELLKKGDSDYYNQRCMDCHSNTEAFPSQTCLAREPSNCIDCHMPRVSPQPPLRFSNHWIGIYEAGAKLIPQKR